MGDSLKTADMGKLPYRVHKQKISDIWFIADQVSLILFMENRHSSEEIRQSIGGSIFQMLPLSGAPCNCSPWQYSSSQKQAAAATISRYYKDSFFPTPLYLLAR